MGDVLEKPAISAQDLWQQVIYNCNWNKDRDMAWTTDTAATIFGYQPSNYTLPYKISNALGFDPNYLLDCLSTAKTIEEGLTRISREVAILFSNFDENSPLIHKPYAQLMNPNEDVFKGIANWLKSCNEAWPNLAASQMVLAVISYIISVEPKRTLEMTLIMRQLDTEFATQDHFVGIIHLQYLLSFFVEQGIVSESKIYQRIRTASGLEKFLDKVSDIRERRILLWRCFVPAILTNEPESAEWIFPLIDKYLEENLPKEIPPNIKANLHPLWKLSLAASRIDHSYREDRIWKNLLKGSVTDIARNLVANKKFSQPLLNAFGSWREIFYARCSEALQPKSNGYLKINAEQSSIIEAEMRSRLLPNALLLQLVAATPPKGYSWVTYLAEFLSNHDNKAESLHPIFAAPPWILISSLANLDHWQQNKVAILSILLAQTRNMAQRVELILLFLKEVNPKAKNDKPLLTTIEKELMSWFPQDKVPLTADKLEAVLFIARDAKTPAELQRLITVELNKRYPKHPACALLERDLGLVNRSAVKLLPFFTDKFASADQLWQAYTGLVNATEIESQILVIKNSLQPVDPQNAFLEAFHKKQANGGAVIEQELITELDRLKARAYEEGISAYLTSQIIVFPSDSEHPLATFAAQIKFSNCTKNNIVYSFALTLKDGTVLKGLLTDEIELLFDATNQISGTLAYTYLLAGILDLLVIEDESYADQIQNY